MKTSTEMKCVLVRHQFELLLLETWDAPSLMVIMTNAERRNLRETLGITWGDVDLNIRLVDECVGTGVARDQRMRRDKGVKVVQEMTRKEDGIQIVVYIVSMKMGEKGPLLDERNYPRKVVIERMFPESCVSGIFAKARALMTAMNAFGLAFRAKEAGDEAVFDEISESLGRFRDRLDGVKRGGLTVTLGEAASKQADPKSPPRGQKKAKVKAEKIDPTDDLARDMTRALTGIDPGAGHEPDAEEEEIPAPPPPVEGDHMVPSARAQRLLDARAAGESPAAPAPQPKKPPKAPRQAPAKLGLKDLADLKDRLPAGPKDGSNGQG